MTAFLQRFAGCVLGVLNGFDRLVFKGKLRQLYSPDGMSCYASANHVLFKEFKTHAKAITQQVLRSSLVEQAKQSERFVYLNSSGLSKDKAAQQIFRRQPAAPGVVAAVLQCVEPCWTFDTASVEGRLTIRGEPGKCSFLYHYLVHPRFGWMYVRVQTWFPFEIQIGLNGREWLARQLDQAGLRYRRSDNKMLWVEDWDRAQQWLDRQLRTNWVKEFDALVRQVHPLQPQHLGRLPVPYNWTVHQSEWATDVAFASRTHLESWYPRWLRHALLNYTSTEVLRFLGRSGRLPVNLAEDVHTELEQFEEGTRLKHWVGSNSLKMYDHSNILRAETTINEPKGFKSYRASETDPEGPKSWRVLRRSVADTQRRAAVSQAANERYLEALSAVTATTTIAEVAAPLCRRVREPGRTSTRQVRALNPLSAEDAALLQVIGDPRWMVSGLRNRDVVAALYYQPTADKLEQRRRSARVTRLLRLLRGHSLLQKVPRTHRYQVNAETRTKIVALLAVNAANAAHLTENAA